MSASQEKARGVIKGIAEDMKLEREITSISYREDYQDFQVILDNQYHCEIRQKLVDTYFMNKNLDVKKEVMFRLEHAEKFEEWEQPLPPSKADQEKDIAIDDSEKYDF